MTGVNPVNALIADAVAKAGRGSAAQLAADTGVNESTVARWIAGQITPSRNRWTVIERSLKLPSGSIKKSHEITLRRTFGPDGIEHLLEALDSLSAEIARLADQVDVQDHRVASLERRLELSESPPKPSAPKRARSNSPKGAPRS